MGGHVLHAQVAFLGNMHSGYGRIRIGKGHGVLVFRIRHNFLIKQVDIMKENLDGGDSTIIYEIQALITPIIYIYSHCYDIDLSVNS